MKKLMLIILLLLLCTLGYPSTEFDDGASEYLQVESAVVGSYPFAMACWFKADDDTVDGSLVFVGDKDVFDCYTSLEFHGDAQADRVVAFQQEYDGASIQQAVSSLDCDADTWYHAAAVFLNVSERHAYTNGSNKNSDSDAVGAMANHDRTSIGARRDSSPSLYFSGKIAAAAIWDLTDWGDNDADRETAFEAALVNLAAGYSPLAYQVGLLAYWPLVDDYVDFFSNYNLTASGASSDSDHPTIFNPIILLNRKKN